MNTINQFSLVSLLSMALFCTLLASCSQQTQEEKLIDRVADLQADTTNLGQQIREATNDQQVQAGVFMVYAFAHPIYTSRFLSGSMMGSAILKTVLTNNGRAEEFESAAQMAFVAIGLETLFGDTHEETAQEAHEREETFNSLAQIADRISDDQQSINSNTIEYNQKLNDLIKMQNDLNSLNH